MARFYPLFSGSSGNCSYFGTASEGVLIDCGMSAKQIILSLQQAGIRPEGIRNIFITHEHIDHIRGVRVFAKKFGCTVYASPGTLRQLLLDGHLDGVTHFDEINEQGVETDHLKITPFHTSHDAADSVGYRIAFSDGRVACVATDTGMITPEIRKGIEKTDFILLESNHDPDMLRTGSYPPPQKARIASNIGHLSNAVCAQTAVSLMQDGTTRFVLGHLSRENNTPDLARQTTLSALTCAGGTEGMDFLLSVAPPRSSGGITIF